MKLNVLGGYWEAVDLHIYLTSLWSPLLGMVIQSESDENPIQFEVKLTDSNLIKTNPNPTPTLSNLEERLSDPINNRFDIFFL